MTTPTEIDTKLLSEVIEAVHLAQMEQCYSLSILRLSRAIAMVYQDCVMEGIAVTSEGVNKRLKKA